MISETEDKDLSTKKGRELSNLFFFLLNVVKTKKPYLPEDTKTLGKVWYVAKRQGNMGRVWNVTIKARQ